jgi:hypothetical protein
LKTLWRGKESISCQWRESSSGDETERLESQQEQQRQRVFLGMERFLEEEEEARQVMGSHFDYDEFFEERSFLL